ncbi:MAG: cell division ATP-binding protein FtsE [Clostridia bacterium]|nr:cell division ATP-binding protein FtsE [Clostridia bacterium]
MIQLTGVSKTYNGYIKALRSVDLTVEDGEFVFIIGPSGAGKSTLLKILTAEVEPTAGTAEVNGYSLVGLKASDKPYLRRTMGVVFQDFRLIDKKTVYENVALAIRVTGAGNREIREKVDSVLKIVGLSHKAKRKPPELSGGEQQRVAIARALVNSPKLIIADEPTGNLDPERTKETMRLFNQINRMGTTVVVITHEKSVVNDMAKRVVYLENGCILRDATGGYNQ